MTNFEKGPGTVVDFAAHSDVDQKQETPALEHLARLSFDSVVETHRTVLMSLQDVANAQRQSVRRKHVVLGTSPYGHPFIAFPKTGFQNGFWSKQLPARVALSRESLAQVDTQTGECPSAGVPGVTEKPVTDTGRKRQRAQKPPDVAAARSHVFRFEARLSQVVNESGRFLATGPGQEFRFMISGQHDYLAAKLRTESRADQAFCASINCAARSNRIMRS